MSKPIPPCDFALTNAARPDACPDPLTLAEGAGTRPAGRPPLSTAPAAPGDAPSAGAVPAAGGPLAFDPVPVAPRINGWTAHRQRLFIRALAETASVAEACEAAGVTSRSAYRLRLRPGAESFDAAWRRAYELGAHRLTAIAPSTACQGRRSGQAPTARSTAPRARSARMARSSPPSPCRPIGC